MTTVVITSTHLTSFAVLVDVAGGLEVTILYRALKCKCLGTVPMIMAAIYAVDSKLWTIHIIRLLPAN